jgi:hypothetical protein
MQDTWWLKLKENKFISFLINYASLFGSLSTLICCALPSLFVMFGLGASFVSFLNVFPQIIWFSEHKTIVFSVSLVLLAVSYIYLKNSEKAICPIEKKDACNNSKKLSKKIIIGSLILNLIGFSSAFILPYI